MAKKILKTIGIILAVLILAFAALIGFLTVTEFKPAAVEPVEVLRGAVAETPLDSSGELTILSWNVGYAGLGEGADFFMDGGKNVKSSDRETVSANLSGISDFIAEQSADFTILQEVDSDSSRTYGMDERTFIQTADSAYALNYSCSFVPFPLPPIGKVHSGLYTVTEHSLQSAERIALPCPFSWPVSAANLKRCLLVSRIDLEGTDRQLVLINLHLEAYDDGEGKAAQTAMLREIMEREYAAGNYVIAGGDFNQSFPEALQTYPIKNESLWTPGILSDGDLSDGWHFAYDVTVPSCRLLNQPYDPDSPETQYYTIDGYILSPNVELDKVETLDTGFVWSDHNPVLLHVKLRAA